MVGRLRKIRWYASRLRSMEPGERLFVILVQETPLFALDVMRTLVHRIRVMNALIA